MNSKIILLICLVLTVPSAIAQNISNKGREFWVGYGHHQFIENGTNTQNMVLYLSAEDQPATVTVTIDSSGLTVGSWWRKTYTIPAYTVIATDIIPKGTINAGPSGSDPNYDARLITNPPPAGSGGAGVFRKKGIHIESNVPIVAYAHIYGSTSSGATVLLPTDAWGYSYVSLNTNQSYGSDCYNWMYVIAARDNTVIEITPSILTRAQNRTGLQPAQPTTVTLMKGQIYQVIGANENADADGNGGNSANGRNLSGTKVRALAGTNGDCFPIAVFAGSSRTSNPISCGSGGGDNDNQQLFPQHAWGKRYLTAPFSSGTAPATPSTSLYRIAIKEPNTIVRRNGTPLTGLQGLLSNYYEFESDHAEYLEADKPIQVVQYMTGGGCLGDFGDGDPEMVVLAPLEQAIKRVGFFRNNQQAINVNFLTLIVPNQGTGLSSLLIGGNNNFDHTYPHPRNPNYTVVIKRWLTGGSGAPPLGQCIASSDSAFTAITYGLGGAESYAYNAGAFLNNLNAIGSIHNEPDTTNGGKNANLFTCVNTPLKLSVLMRYQPLKLVFQINSLGPTVVSPSTNVTLDPASTAADGTVDIGGVTYYKYTLPATYTFLTPGTHRIAIKSTSLTIDNCNNTEDLNISVEVRAQPNTDFTWTFPTGCLKDSVFITGPSTTSGYTVDQWRWTFSDVTIDSVQNPHKSFLTPGNHTIKLDVVSKDGCIASTTKPVVVFDVPTASIGVNPASVCEGGSLTFTPTTTYAGPTPVNEYYWDFANGNTMSTSTGVQSTAYPKYGTYKVRLVTKVSKLCISDTVDANVSVYSKPVPGVDFAGGCLAPNEAVTFTDTTKTPDGQAITAWSWNFGDPNATPPNNVSTQPNPTHSYSDLSISYNIQFRATTANGCFKDTVYRATFKAKPVLAYAALTPVCEDVAGTVSVAKGSLVNSVTGTGIYKGPATTSTGNFTPSQAGPGVHTIWYIYSATNGCIDSIPQTIEVYAKPTTDFTVTANVCLNQNATFDDQSNIGSGSIASWKWDFGDGNTATYTNGNSFNRQYTTAGTYNIKLTTTSNRGCIGEKTGQLTIHALPVAAFDLPSFICLPGDVAEFKNNATVPGNGALTYEWNFGDGTPVSTDKDPTHAYATAGDYNITLTATSAQGCSHSVTNTLAASKFFAKPTASFTVAPDKLCQGSDNVFTDASTPTADINKWEWHFGDGTTSDQQNPVKRFRDPGDYNVTLQVTNSVGCESAPFPTEVNVYLQPVIEAGDPIVVPQGTVVTFKAKANDESRLQFLWTPGAGLSDPTAIRPSFTAVRDQVYILTATGENDCTAEDEVSVKILRPVNVPNAFSPNGDGINDRWQLNNLADYPGSTVEVFNRYGQRVFYSTGYTNSWNGTYDGKPLPVAVYYYIIHLKNGFKPITGSVTIVK